MGGEFAVSAEEQRRQVEALKNLEGTLERLSAAAASSGGGDAAGGWEGLALRLYHPESRPLGTVRYVDIDGAFNLRTQPISSHVAGGRSGRRVYVWVAGGLEGGVGGVAVEGHSGKAAATAPRRVALHDPSA